MNSVERVKQVCKERKIPISRLEKELGFANGYIGQLKKGSFPDDRLRAIAKYLNVSADFLIYGNDCKEESEGQYYINDEAREMAQFMFENPEYKVLFDASRNVKKEDIEFVKQLMDRFKHD